MFEDCVVNESNNEKRTDRPNFKQRVTAEWARFRELAWWKRLVHPLAIVASLSIIALFCLLAAGFIRLVLPRSGSIRFWRAQDYVRPESAADRAALLLAEVYATQAFIEIIGSLVLVITVIAALYTARQTQRSLELGREQLRISQDGQITDRFAKAIEMLGATHSNGTPQMEVRLSGLA